MAAWLGVTQGNVHFYEKGQTVPPKVAQRLIASARAAGHQVTLEEIYADLAPAPKARGKGVKV